MPSKYPVLYPVLKCTLALGLSLPGLQAPAQDAALGFYRNGNSSCQVTSTGRINQTPETQLRCRTREKEVTTGGKYVIVEREGIETNVDGRPVLELRKIRFIDPKSGETTGTINVLPEPAYAALKDRIEAGAISAIQREGEDGKRHLNILKETVVETIKPKYLTNR